MKWLVYQKAKLVRDILISKGRVTNDGSKIVIIIFYIPHVDWLKDRATSSTSNHLWPDENLKIVKFLPAHRDRQPVKYFTTAL